MKTAQAQLAVDFFKHAHQPQPLILLTLLKILSHALKNLISLEEALQLSHSLVGPPKVCMC